LAAEKQIIGNRKRRSDHTSHEEDITLLETSHENMPSDAIVPVAKELFLVPVTQMVTIPRKRTKTKCGKGNTIK
jgi:hypothetical protein